VSAGTGCGDRAELEAYAEGSLAADRAEHVAAHVPGCPRCRSLVARRTAPLPRARRRDPFPGPDRDPPGDDNPPPAAVLRAYLRLDAREREYAISRFWVILTLVSMPGIIPPAFWGYPWFTALAVPIHLAFLAYELLVMWHLRRAATPPALPLASTLVEAGFFAAMQVAAIYFIPQTIATSNPALPLRGAVIVFTAIRAQPRLCLVAGAAGAIESLLLAVPLSRIEGVEVITLGALAMRAGFMFAAGVAGAIFARYLITRAERVLSEVRALDLFGKYVIAEQIGAGGMGEVFRATYCPEGGFVRPVAVKRLRQDLSGDTRFEEAFRREARVCASLTHPNLVQVLDCGKFRGSFLVAMELVDGPSLRALARAGPLAPAAVAFIGAELADALDFIHTRRGRDGEPAGLVHCDLNPPNVLLSRLGEVKLGDFGVARAAEPLSAGAGSSAFAGKAAYAAPEQLRHEPLDERADLFALGLTLFEALTGERMFHPPETALTHAVRAPSSVRPDTPPVLEAILLGLLELDRDRRIPSAAAVREMLRGLTGELAPTPHGENQLVAALRRHNV
jgi:serine/threonine-protein kinase